jgi:thioredoxin-like negative regulator of GroEL
MTEPDLLASLASGQLMVVEFGEPWCIYSRALAPRVAALAGCFRDRVVVARIDASQAKTVTDTFEVCFVPAVVVFHHGRVVRCCYGAELNVSRMAEVLENELGLQER